MTTFGQLQLSHKIHNLDPQGISDDFQGLNRHIALPSLNLAHVCSMQPGAFRENVLSQLTLVA